MKRFIVLLLCLLCLTGCGKSLQGTWKVNSAGTQRNIQGTAFANDANMSLLSPAVSGAVEFRSDGSITSEVGKVEGLTWHGDYICLKADIKKLREGREPLLRFMGRLLYSDESIAQQLKDLKDGKVMEGDAYCPMARGIAKKDISESADKVEFRIHWVDADHFDLGSTSFSRVKLPK
jgi:hypothetical protein